MVKNMKIKDESLTSIMINIILSFIISEIIFLINASLGWPRSGKTKNMTVTMMTKSSIQVPWRHKKILEKQRWQKTRYIKTWLQSLLPRSLLSGCTQQVRNSLDALTLLFWALSFTILRKIMFYVPFPEIHNNSIICSSYLMS